MTNETWKQQALQLSKTDMSWRAIAEMVGVSKSTVSDMLRSYYKAMYAVTDKTEQPIPEGVRILLIDVESAPTTAYVWGRWDQTVNQKQVVKEGYLLTYSAKWLGQDTIISSRITEAGTDDDIVRELADLMNQADVIVAHNALKFDVPLIKTRMLALGLTPPLPSKIVDTLRIAKAEFRFPSNSLDNIAAYLGLPRKISHSGFELWTRCMAMEKEAFDEMLEYNVQDVVVLEELYLRIRHWSKTHPNVALHQSSTEPSCVCCGSKDLKPVAKKFYTGTSEFDMFVCNSCGKPNRKRKSSGNKHLLTNVGK